MPTLLDIETAANLDLLDFLPPISAPGNYKKPESIARWLAENSETARQGQIDQLPLDPLLFRLRAIGIAAGPQAEPETWLIHTEAEEKAALHKLWRRLCSANAYPIVGYNVLAFDLPRLLWRALALDVPPYRPLDLRRYGGDALDLLLLLKNYDSRTRSLAGMGFKTVCAILGIENPLPEIDSSMVAQMSDAEVIVYNGNELRMMQQLYRRMAGIYFEGHTGPQEKAF